MTDRSKLQIASLSELDLLELEEELPSGAVERQIENVADTGQHGDLGLTTAIVILSAAAIHGLAVWMAKRRGEIASTDDVSVEQCPDGSITLRMRRESRGRISDAPDPAVVKALQTQLSTLLPLGER
jgi:hypothetical protein